MLRAAVQRTARAAAAPRVAAGCVGAVRNLNLHEYQSKSLMEKYNVTVQRGAVAASAEEAAKVAQNIKATNPGAELIVKAQIHAGGRGKGHFKGGLKGGVKICNTPEEVKKYASQMIGDVLVTKQTGEAGQPCNAVLVNEGITIEEEKYFAILLDRAHQGPVVVASAKGGMDIEAVAEEDPDAIVTVPIDIFRGITPEQTSYLADALGFKGALKKQAMNNMKALYDVFVATDSTQVEINPLAVASDGKVYCVDAKFGFDDNAAYRQKDIFAQRDTSMEDPRDVKAEKAGLNYIGLDGNIGCMVNGAGLAMATMDIIKLNGGNPANFLDVGGGATKEQVTQAFSILLDDPNVKSILVNIFGGIMKCDIIAEGIVAAARTLDIQIPVVVRLAGTNVELGQQILRDSGLDLIAASDLDDAAAKAVASVQA